MTKIEARRDVLYHLGNATLEGDRHGTERSRDVGTVMALAVRDLGRKIAEAAVLGPVEVVAVD